MKKLLITLSLLVLNPIAIASTSSDVALLSYGFIEPKQTLTIKLTGLQPNVLYNVICENINMNMPSDVDVYYKGAPSAMLDNKVQSRNVFTLEKDHYASGYKLTFTYVMNDNSSTIDLINLDDTARVNLHNCVAKVQH